MKTLSTTFTIENDPRWAAVVARDPQADGQFVYAVKTTGIYCRPSSLSRLPKPQNVVFFDTEEQARAAGFRPSKRAAADQSLVAAQHATLVAAACQSRPSLAIAFCMVLRLSVICRSPCESRLWGCCCSASQSATRGRLAPVRPHAARSAQKDGIDRHPDDGHSIPAPGFQISYSRHGHRPSTGCARG